MPDPMAPEFRESVRTTTAFQRLRAETDNLRAALFWATEQRSSQELRLATLYQLSPQVGPTEARHVLRESLAQSTVGGVERARALLAASGMARVQGDIRDAQASLEEALALYRAAGDAFGVTEGLSYLAMVTIDTGDLDRAKALMDEAESVALGTGDDRLIASMWGRQVFFPLLRDDLVEARAQTERVLRLQEEIGDEEGAAFTRLELASIKLLQGQTREALRGLEESLRFLRELHYPGWIVMPLWRLAAALAAAGESGPAVRIYAAVEAFRTTRGAELSGPFRELFERPMGPVRRAADEPRFSEERAAGAAMSLDEAAEYALGIVQRLREDEAGSETS
jgi:tetratricopeptide (TPR) repeat protein